MTHPKLQLYRCAPILDGGLVLHEHIAHIIRVDKTLAQGIHSAGQIVLLITQHAQIAAVEVNIAAGDIPIPQAIVSRLQHIFEAAIATGDLLLLLFQGGELSL
jgi:uncharacterized phosphosugar-binding protein